jgi:hypothetical protein
LSPVLPDQVRDYRLLLERWLALSVKQTGLSLRIYAEAGGYPLAVLETVEPDPDRPSVYLSAGIHGDEPAGVEGLLRWASEDPRELRGINWMIFPCLNPWGLERNIRFDAEGRDLNRAYNSRKVPQIAAQREILRGWSFAAAAHLHEDYDARGFYLYEIAAARPNWGEILCLEVASLMPADPRRRIDGHPARGGVIRRRVTPDLLKGHPEAFLLHFHHADRTFTLETPSEADLGRRVAVQKRFLKRLTAMIR